MIVILVTSTSPLRGQGGGDENLEKLRKLGDSVQALDPGKYKVLRWIEDQQARQANLKWRQEPVPAGHVYQIGQQYVVQAQQGPGQSAGAWYTGWAAGGNDINCSAQSYATLDELISKNSYPKLPKMPSKWTLREVARFPASPIRLAGAEENAMYVLGSGGDVWRMDLATGKLTDVLHHADYLPPGSDALGLAWDAEGNRLYIVTNRKDDSVKPILNRVTIFRTTTVGANHLPAGPKPWLTTDYPYGVHTFNHGVNHIAFGPDGMLYVSSGSRTDHGELGGDEPGIAQIKGGEVPTTACIWRLDPNSDTPKIEIFARGLRNAFGFCWDEQGRMFVTENGPNADAPEELNLVEAQKHYGFPFQFSDWPDKAYPDQPDVPVELKGKLVEPIINDGPDGRDPSGEQRSTLEAHSCPAGIVFLGKAFPADVRGTFLVARFGNFIGPRDTGFDVLQMRLKGETGGRLHAEIHTFLAPVARPLDIVAHHGRIYICEYSRQTSNTGMLDLPGRVLELSCGQR